MDGLENRHHKLYVDNYYTSPSLFLNLYFKGTNACGTARTNRKFYPAELAYKASEGTKRQRGFYDYRSNGPLMACVWKDKKIINFLSTMHCAEANTSVTRQLGMEVRKRLVAPHVFLITRNLCVEFTSVTSEYPITM